MNDSPKPTKTDNNLKQNDITIIASTSKSVNTATNNRANKRKHEDQDVIVIESDNETQSKNRYILSIIEELEKCKLGDEIKTVMKILQPTRDDLLNRFTNVKKDLEYLLSKMLRNFELVVFGSIVSGLAFRGELSFLFSFRTVLFIYT
jgi:DNA polymerase sigma